MMMITMMMATPGGSGSNRSSRSIVSGMGKRA
jgi:hypothetical protein